MAGNFGEDGVDIVPFAAVEGADDLAQARAALLLRRFAVPEPSSYDVFHAIREQAERHAGVW